MKFIDVADATNIQLKTLERVNVVIDLDIRARVEVSVEDFWLGTRSSNMVSGGRRTWLLNACI